MKLTQKYFSQETSYWGWGRGGSSWIQRNISFLGRCDLFGRLSCIVVNMISQIKRYKCDYKSDGCQCCRNVITMQSFENKE